MLARGAGAEPIARIERADALKGALVTALLVGTGGFLGSMLRYGVTALVHGGAQFTSFPYGTLVVNTAGCLAIGFLAGLVDARQLLSPEARLFTLIGVLGGFTTFSTLGYETFAMLRDGDPIAALANVAAHVVGGVACVWLGYAAATSI